MSEMPVGTLFVASTALHLMLLLLLLPGWLGVKMHAYPSWVQSPGHAGWT